jgi:hypothetical protein
MRFINGNDKVHHGLAEDGTFRLTSLEIALVELSPPVTCPAYRFRAQVRQERVAKEGLAGGKIGLFFARRPMAPVAPGSNLFRLEFTDFPDLRDPPELDDRARPISRLFFSQFTIPPAGQAVGSASTAWGAIKYPMPPIGTARPWHTIVVDVTNRSIVIRMDDESPKIYSLDWMSQSLVGTAQPQLMPIDRPPRGAVGLYLFQCVGSFRNVNLTPLRSGT